MPRPEVKQFKLNKSTPAGLRADNNYKKGAPTSINLNSVVDPRSVFIEMKICEKKIEAVCVAAQVFPVLVLQFMTN